MANGTKVVFKSKVRLYRTFLFLLFLGSAVIGILAAAVVLVVSLLFIEALICSRHSIVLHIYHLQLPPCTSVLAGFGEIIWLAAKTL